eukprot:12242455-Prorocentrum_lima.AAC.1
MAQESSAEISSNATAEFGTTSWGEAFKSSPMRVSTASEMRSPSSKRAGDEISGSARSKRLDLSPAPGSVAGSG